MLIVIALTEFIARDSFDDCARFGLLRNFVRFLIKQMFDIFVLYVISIWAVLHRFVHVALMPLRLDACPTTFVVMDLFVCLLG